MNGGNKTKTLGVVGGVILLVITVLGFAWLWSSSQPAAVSNTAIDQKYQTVEISGLVSTAQSLIVDKQNAGSLPVQAPAAGQMGKDNPFVAQ